MTEIENAVCLSCGKLHDKVKVKTEVKEKHSLFDSVSVSVRFWTCSVCESDTDIEILGTVDEDQQYSVYEDGDKRLVYSDNDSDEDQDALYYFEDGSGIRRYYNDYELAYQDATGYPVHEEGWTDVDEDDDSEMNKDIKIAW